MVTGAGVVVVVTGAAVVVVVFGAAVVVVVTGAAVVVVVFGVAVVVVVVAGAALNKIPGADKLVSALTKGKIDISNKTFAGAWQSAQGVISDVAAQGADLFSMDTLTAANKFIKPETLAKIDAAKVSVDQDPATAIADATEVPDPAKVPDPVKPAEVVKPAEPVTQTDPFVQEQLDTPVRDPGVVRSYDETQGALYRQPDQPPATSLLGPTDTTIQIDAPVTTPDVTGDIVPDVGAPVIPEKPTAFGKLKDFVADEVSERIDSFDPVKGAQRAFAAYRGQPTSDITANDELGGGYAVDFGAATIGYNPDGAMNYFPLVGNLRGVA